MAVAKQEKTGNPITRGVEFYKDSLEEVKKVHYPSREETIRMTIVVIIAVIFFATFLGLADLVVGKLMRSILT